VPNAYDVRLLQFAAAKGLLEKSLAEACLQELRLSEKQGQALRASQVLLKRRLLSSTQITDMMRQLQGLGSTKGQQQVVGEETFVSMRRQEQAAPVKAGDTLGGMRIGRELARGGMGILYEADPGDGQRLVVKVLNPEVATPSRVKRFEQEADLAMALDHPEVIKVHQFGWERKIYYLVMDRFEGQALDEPMRLGRVLPRTALHIVARVARACAYMHGKGVVHRDLKPANIMVGPGGKVCLVDLGLAKDFARDDTAANQIGKLIGTPAYMSPEQATGQIGKVGPWTDVYGLGAIIYRALTGRYPHAENSFMKTIQAIATKPARPLRELRPDAPPELEALVQQAMALDPQARPYAAQLAQHIDLLVEQVPATLPAPPAGHLA
jgi:serine/threonine protein kinase